MDELGLVVNYVTLTAGYIVAWPSGLASLPLAMLAPIHPPSTRVLDHDAEEGSGK